MNKKTKNDKTAVNGKHSPKFINGITRRWIATTLIIIYVVLLVVAFAASGVLKNYYYKVVENAIDSKIQYNTLQSYFSGYLKSDSNSFDDGARDFVEKFSYNNLMELWVVDGDGRIVVSSNGFDVGQDVEISEFQQIKQSGDNVCAWTGKVASGEKIFAKTFAIRDSVGNFAGCLRAMISLEELDRQHIKYTLLFLAIAVVIMIFVTFSGAFFVKSIVNPVKEINRVAKKIADGDFKQRVNVKKENNDEITELCKTVNFMTDRIENSEKIKNDFISTVSHELRTPLTAIKGWAETLENTPKDDEETINLGIDIICREADRLDNMVEDLLDFSRMESGREIVHKTETDIFEVLDFTVNAFRGRCARDSIEMEYLPCGENAQTMADAEQLKQVFVNVLDNAFKYTGENGKVIVQTSIIHDNAVICVSDNGCGIPKEDLPHIKEKFYKANNNIRGSGIGLSVVDQIVKNHNGTLNIDSIEDKGTVVTISIPL